MSIRKGLTDDEKGEKIDSTSIDNQIPLLLRVPNWDSSAGSRKDRATRESKAPWYLALLPTVVIQR